MSNKENNTNSTDNLEYDKILEEEVITTYENKYQSDSRLNEKEKKYNRLKRTPIEIVNRLFFFFFYWKFHIFFLFSLFRK